jgi:excisionase family DNA binding protein
MPEVYMNRDDVARHLQISLSKVDGMRRANTLTHIKIGRTVRFPKSAVDALMESRTVPSATPVFPFKVKVPKDYYIRLKPESVEHRAIKQLVDRLAERTGEDKDRLATLIYETLDDMLFDCEITNLEPLAAEHTLS